MSNETEEAVTPTVPEPMNTAERAMLEMAYVLVEEAAKCVESAPHEMPTDMATLSAMGAVHLVEYSRRGDHRTAAWWSVRETMSYPVRSQDPDTHADSGFATGAEKAHFMRETLKGAQQAELVWAFDAVRPEEK